MLMHFQATTGDAVGPQAWYSEHQCWKHAQQEKNMLGHNNPQNAFLSSQLE